MAPSERGEADQGRTVIGHAGRPHPSAGGQCAMASTTRGPHSEVILWGTDAGIEPASLCFNFKRLHDRVANYSCPQCVPNLVHQRIRESLASPTGKRIESSPDRYPDDSAGVWSSEASRTGVVFSSRVRVRELEFKLASRHRATGVPRPLRAFPRREAERLAPNRRPSLDPRPASPPGLPETAPAAVALTGVAPPAGTSESRMSPDPGA